MILVEPRFIGSTDKTYCSFVDVEFGAYPGINLSDVMGLYLLTSSFRTYVRHCLDQTQLVLLHPVSLAAYLLMRSVF